MLEYNPFTSLSICPRSIVVYLNSVDPFDWNFFTLSMSWLTLCNASNGFISVIRHHPSSPPIPVSANGESKISHRYLIHVPYIMRHQVHIQFRLRFAALARSRTGHVRLYRRQMKSKTALPLSDYRYHEHLHAYDRKLIFCNQCSIKPIGTLTLIQCVNANFNKISGIR